MSKEMPNRIALTLLLACGCGRIAFDAATDAATDGSSSAVTLSYPTRNIEAILDVTAIQLTPTVTGTAPVFSSSPALPTGLALDPATGVISGTPTTSVDNAPYTITASNASASASFALSATVLPGYVVDTTVDGIDDDGGTDVTCHSTLANGCSLRAAIQTGNRRVTKQLILLGAATHAIDSPLEPINNDIVLAGVGAGLSRVHPASVHPGFGMIKISTAHELRVEGVAFDEFGNVNGAVFTVTGGSLIANECSFTNNASAGSGGVLFIASGASASFDRCTFTANSSFGGNGWGGVIDGEDANTTIVVKGSFATQNSAPWGSFSHITQGTRLRLENSTLFANTSTTSGTLASPGGVYTVVNSTIAYNTNTNATPVGVAASAGLYSYSAPCHYDVTSSIIAFNTGFDGAQVNCMRLDMSTTMTSGGGNIFGDDAKNCASYFTADGDRTLTDPGIDPSGPSDHGGPTPTINLTAGSQSIDTGQDVGCPPVDQRGFPRPAGAGCDVGALELQ
jgi:CSLREA domain-containing protein